MEKSAIYPTRDQDYPAWYQAVIAAADLAEVAPVRGCMVIKPWGYAIWENIQKILDERFKETGHVNAYFPLLIPLSHLEKETQHVEGFAKECAVVTHHRLKVNKQGHLEPDAALEEPLVIRPTSETMIGAMYARWIQSYRDLPLCINQWANIVRWEMRTRLFLRTSEFLWQEGHTAHATAKEALEETHLILNLYKDFAQDVLAMPVIMGEKTITERFPGAVHTYCIEAMMQDRKALQAGTSHFLGQNFSKASEIKFTDEQGKPSYVWTTSWGVSTRLIGGIIMTHSDDDGLVLPPRIAPYQIVILPVYKNEKEKGEVIQYCQDLKAALLNNLFAENKLRIHIDGREIRGGEKNWQWIKKGVPIRLEIGLRDIQSNRIPMYRRDQLSKAKEYFTKEDLIAKTVDILTSIQDNLFKRALSYQKKYTYIAKTYEEFKEIFTNPDKGGFVECYAIDDPCLEEFLTPLKVSARCILLSSAEEIHQCVFTGKPTNKRVIFAKSY